MSWNDCPVMRNRRHFRQKDLIKLALESIFWGKRLAWLRKVHLEKFNLREVDIVVSNLSTLLSETKTTIMKVTSWSHSYDVKGPKEYEYAFGPATIREGALIIPLLSKVSNFRKDGFSWWREHGMKFDGGLVNTIAVNPLSRVPSDTGIRKGFSNRGMKQNMNINEGVEESLMDALFQIHNLSELAMKAHVYALIL